MEDFSNARSADAQPSGLLAELQEKTSSNNTELAFALIAQERREGPGKDVADRLDKELKEYADSKLDNPSKDILAFQKMIDKFCSTADKKKAMEELGDSYSRLRVQMGKDIEATYEEREAESAKQPGRKELNADYEKKLDKFFDMVDASPDRWKIFEMMEWKDGDNKASVRARMREGLKDNKPLLSAYDEMSGASDKIDANKSAKEKELEALHNKQVKDYHAIEPVANKAYIRSTIEY